MRIDTVRQSEIYDPINSAKRNGRFRTVLGQRIQPFPLSASQNEGERIFKDRTGTRRNSFQPVFLMVWANLGTKAPAKLCNFGPLTQHVGNRLTSVDLQRLASAPTPRENGKRFRWNSPTNGNFYLYPQRRYYKRLIR